MQMQFKAYGVDNTRILIAAAARGRTNVDDDMATFGNDIGATHQVDGSTAATSSRRPHHRLRAVATAT